MKNTREQMRKKTSLKKMQIEKDRSIMTEKFSQMNSNNQASNEALMKSIASKYEIDLDELRQRVQNRKERAKLLNPILNESGQRPKSQLQNSLLPPLNSKSEKNI